ncbi:hypothetical protein ACIRS1_20160 [Kitasatospora sp. NPDC101176]|uniref:hypothetical protein n=1 Tax=Kitasatospora sp. NPDC101176 TaxID=3364099 RepID=UPI0037FC4921
MGDGDTNDRTAGPTGGPVGVPMEKSHGPADGLADRAAELTPDPTGGPDGGPRELSRTAAVATTVLAAVCGAAVLLAVFHWLGFGVPWIGWMVAKAGIKLVVGGFAGLAAACAWLRTRLRSGAQA